jgi:Uma2 family endonuclease
MATALAQTIAPDIVISFEINPSTLLQFLESRAEGGPRLKCFEGSVTLVSPGMPHEIAGGRLASLVLAICLELRIRVSGLASTTWTLPLGAGDTAYEADHAYYIQSHGRAKTQQPPDLAIEIVVSHSEKKALRAGAFLKIPEMWVLDVRRRRLTFLPPGSQGQAERHLPAPAPEPGVPLLDVGRGPGAARRPRDRRRRLP